MDTVICQTELTVTSETGPETRLPLCNGKLHKAKLHELYQGVNSNLQSSNHVRFISLLLEILNTIIGDQLVYPCVE